MIGSNNKTNVLLNINGEPIIEQPILAGHKIYSVAAYPTFKSTKGSIAFGFIPESGKEWDGCVWATIDGL